MGHTKVRCTKPIVEDDDTGFAGDTNGGGFAASVEDAGANDGGGDYSANDYSTNDPVVNDYAAESTPASVPGGNTWGGSAGDNW